MSSIQPRDNHVGPFELGLSGDEAAIPRLVEFLSRGNANERRLAASAIGKLASRFPKQALQARDALVECLGDPKPQVRQDALKTLSQMVLKEEHLNRITHVSQKDDRYYNKIAAAGILRKNGAVMNPPSTRQPQQAGPPSSSRDRIEACLASLDIIESDLADVTERIRESEIALAEARHDLEYRQHQLIADGVEGRNEAERRARVSVALVREQRRVDDAQGAFHSARRDFDELKTALDIAKLRLNGLALLIGVHASAD